MCFILALNKGKEESPVDMDTITLDPEEEVRRGSRNNATVFLDCICRVKTLLLLLFTQQYVMSP